MNSPFTFNHPPDGAARRTGGRHLCPRCNGPLIRMHRRVVDRIISVVVPVHRYRCVAVHCQWEGNIRRDRR